MSETNFTFHRITFHLIAGWKTSTFYTGSIFSKAIRELDSKWWLFIEECLHSLNGWLKNEKKKLIQIQN